MSTPTLNAIYLTLYRNLHTYIYVCGIEMPRHNEWFRQSPEIGSAFTYIVLSMEFQQLRFRLTAQYPLC